jgi:alanyl-tRNA synthetase
MRREGAALRQLAWQLKTSPEEAGERVRKLQTQLKEKDKEIEVLKNKLSQGGAGTPDIMAALSDRDGFKALVSEVEADNPKTLRSLADSLRDRLPKQSLVMVLGARAGGKAMLLAWVSQDMTSRFQAGNIIKELAPLVGGGGGGRPDMAQAGGTEAEGLEAALQKAREILGLP